MIHNELQSTAMHAIVGGLDVEQTNNLVALWFKLRCLLLQRLVLTTICQQYHIIIILIIRYAFHLSLSLSFILCNCVSFFPLGFLYIEDFCFCFCFCFKNNTTLPLIYICCHHRICHWIQEIDLKFYLLDLWLCFPSMIMFFNYI